MKNDLEMTTASASIEERIFNIRGKQVMIDKDLALLYRVETKRLNEQVKRNIERFPEDFMFQLTMEECLRSQIATLNTGQGVFFDGQRYDAYSFVAELVRKAARSQSNFSTVYLIGASIKALGKKWFGFTQLENTDAEDLLGRM